MEKEEKKIIKGDKNDLDIGSKNSLEELQAIYKSLLIDIYNTDLSEIEIIEIYLKEKG